MPYIQINNRKIFYRQQGKGPLLILLPGNTASSASHIREIDFFSRNYHVVCMDLFGTGNSGRMADWQLDWWQQGGIDAARLADSLGEERFYLIGCSGGAVAALWTAIHHPQKVQAVILDSMVPILTREHLVHQVCVRQQPDYDTENFWHMAHGNDWKQVVNEDSKLMLKLADAGGHFFANELPSIRCPMLICGSFTDSLLQGQIHQMLELSQQIPHSRLYLANDGDHPLMWTQPEDFYTTAAAFLAAHQISPVD